MIALFVVLLLLAIVLQQLSLYQGSEGIETEKGRLRQYLKKRSERLLNSLKTEVTVSKPLVEPGEKTELLLLLKNDSKRFYPFLKVKSFLPMEVLLAEALSSDSPKKEISMTTWLLPKQQAVHRFPLTFPKRGRYLFTTMMLSQGDFLGIDSRVREEMLFAEVVVMPQKGNPQKVEKAFGGMLGDISVQRFLFEDPILTVGYREYTGREPMKMLSWTQMARTGQVMVRQYDYTVEATVCVVLDATSQIREETKSLEDCFVLARSLCEALEDRHISYSFYTNAVFSGDYQAGNSSVSGLGPQHFMHIMEGLGRALPAYTFNNSALLERVVRHATGSPAILYLTATQDPERIRLAKAIAARSGLALFVIPLSNPA